MANLAEFLCTIIAIAVIAFVAVFVADIFVGLIFSGTPATLP